MTLEPATHLPPTSDTRADAPIHGSKWLRLTSDGTIPGTQLTDSEGNRIRGIQRITWTADVDTGEVRAVVELNVIVGLDHFRPLTQDQP